MKYELMLILSPKLSDKEIEKTLAEVKETLTENACSVFAEDTWGKRDLAYKISSFSTGYYVVMNFEGEPEGIQAIHKDFRIQPGLVRYLLIKVADGYKLEKFEDLKERTPRKLETRQAEELKKKVTSSRTKKPVKEEAAPEASKEKDAKLDEKLSAIINDTDIDL